MSEVKTLRIKGEVKLGFRLVPFVKEVRALSREEALEKVYNEIGGRNKLKRKQLKILAVEEIKPEEIKDPQLRALAGMGE
ncbi:50S ribosomal protein L18Ae [Candidatus Hecatella orcuttiae]|uniref:50S ribosomal protein L18Ae n=1 Tax=Candidatus Hecatella orcuttiae TaxID=1935119 RepID=UPI0028683310|nr:50S ribosomal protein L18Ae [Candidatus Hecatella orcuttiae]